MKCGVTLQRLNQWLRKIGLVLVIAIETDPAPETRTPTRLWIERARRYDQRLKRAKA